MLNVSVTLVHLSQLTQNVSCIVCFTDLAKHLFQVWHMSQSHLNAVSTTARNQLNCLFAIQTPLENAFYRRNQHVAHLEQHVRIAGIAKLF